MSPLVRRLATVVALLLVAWLSSLALRRERDLATAAGSVAAPETVHSSGWDSSVAPPIAAPAIEPAAAATPAATTAGADPFADFRTWTARYLAAPASEHETMLGEGVRIAGRRRDAMAALIPNDPRLALEQAVPMTVRQQLPPEIVAQLEERVSARGFYGVLGVAGAPGGQAPIRREVRLADGRRFDAHTFGRRAAQPTTENVALAGISVPNPEAPRRPLLALDERPLRVLEPGEIPDPAKPAIESCPVSGKTTAVKRADDGTLPPVTGDTPAVEIGGTIHYLCNGGHIQAIEEGLVAAEGATGGAVKPTGSVNSSQSTGVRSLLYMRVAFPETNREPQTEAAAYDMMRQVNDWLVENSYGNVYLVTTVTPLLVLPYSEAWYKSGSTGGGDEYDVRADALAVARRMGYDANHYDLDIVVYTGGPGNFGGLGYVGTKGSWLKSINVGVACHELGHNFGLWHANFWATTDNSAVGNGSNTEYGNTFDTMGSASAGDLHFNANHRSLLNWIPSQTFVKNVTASGTYRIFTLDQPRLDPANRYAFRVRKDNLRTYWAEFRQRSLGNNKWTKDGILLNWAPWATSNGGAQLLDTTPGSPDGKTDAATVIGATFSDVGAGVHITPVGKGGTVPESIDVVVNLGSFPGNQPPTLSIAAIETAAPGESVNFTAAANDPDADALAYAWDFGDGTFSNTNSATVSKSWSSEGEYVVRCTVSDMKGHTASVAVVVTVGSPSTYRISGQVTVAGQPLADVRVSNGQIGTAYRGALTDSEGRYTIAGLSSGSVTLAATLGGHTFTPSGFANPVTVGPNFNGANFTASETPVVTLVASDPVASEAAGNPGQLTLARTGPTTTAVPVRLLAPSGSALRTSDYTLAPELTTSTPYFMVTIPAGQASLSIVLTPNDDTGAEGQELAIFEVAAGSGYIVGSAARAEIAIEDNDSTLPVVRLRVADADATEGGDSAGFVVTRSGDTSSALVVKFSLSGTAASGQDYVALGSQVIIPAGQTSVPLIVAPLDDSLAEGTEIVTVTLATDPAYIRVLSAAESSGTVNLLDDDIPILIAVATDATASETGADTGTFIITRTGSTTQALTVNYALSGSALQGVDYLTLPGVLSIPAGSSVGSVTITPVDDGIGEPAQTVFLQLRGGAGYVAGDPGNATVTIDDGGDVPVVIVGVSDGAVAEPSDAGKFKFTTAGTGSGEITVHYTVSGTATSDVDFNGLSGTLSMGRSATAEIVVTPIDDTELEGLETITVAIVPDAAYSTHLDTEATINLADDDQPVVSVSATNTNFTEAIGTGRFYFSRSGAATSALAVNYTLSGTATSGEDYNAPAGVITFAAGAATAQLDLTPINDVLPEATETIILALAPGAYGYGLASAKCYLNDNDTLPLQVTFSTPTGSGSEAVGTIDLPVVLTAVAAGEVTVEYVIGGGNAIAGIDYTLAPGVLVFAPGEIIKTIPLTILDDAFNEPAQTVQIRLQFANGVALGASTHTFTIIDNDPLPTPTIAFAATDGGGPESIAAPQIVVSLSAAQTTPVSVNLSASGSATAVTDFIGGSGLLTFAPGETAKVLPLTIFDDSAYEPDKTIVLTLGNPGGATLGAATVFTYLLGDDDVPVVAITATDDSAAEAGSNPGTVIVTRVGDLAGELTVQATIDGTATADSDYAALITPIVIPAGSASATLTVTPVDDLEGEGGEFVLVTLNPGSGYVLGGTTSASVTIADDDINTAPTFTFNNPPDDQAIAIPAGVGLQFDILVSDDGRPAAPGAVTTTWSKVSGPGTVTFGNPAAANTTALFSAAGSYELQLAASDGQLQTIRQVHVIVGGGSAWTGTTTGGATPAGSFIEDDGTLTVRGGGANISGTSDQFYFVQQAFSGDFRFTARVASFAGGNSSAKAGLMFRESTAPNSAGAYVSLYGPASNNNARSWHHRATTGASYSITNVTGARVYPCWIRLTRSGGAMTGETSADGIHWISVGSAPDDLPNNGLLGFAVTSNDPAALATVIFDHVSITSPNGNTGPLVNAGPTQTIATPDSATLAGTVSDDGQPAPGTITTLWEKISGPGAVTFANANVAQTTATFSNLGTYVLRLRAYDGWVRTFHDVTVTNELPVITVTASQPNAEEAHLVNGVFTISRTGAGLDALVVRYTLSGTATEQVDYEAQVRIPPNGAPNGAVTLGVGQTSIEILAAPLADALAEGAETVKLTVTTEPTYTIGFPSSGTVTIADLPLDGWRQSLFGADANNPAIAGDNADPDGDGRVNWFEFALGGNPLSGLLEPLPQVALEGADLTLTYRRPTYAPDFTYSIEETLDLALPWASASFYEETLASQGETLLIKAHIPAGSGPQKLLRLRVSQP